jgi:ATP-binding cassette subfamily F protein 3
MSVLSASKLALSFGNTEIFSGVSLNIPDNAHIGMVGPNGAGKSSLVKLIIGELEPESGDFFMSGGTRIGYVPQIADLTGSGSLLDEIKTAFNELFDLENSMASILNQIAAAVGNDRTVLEEDYSSMVSRYEYLGGYTYLNRLDHVLEGVGLSKECLEADVRLASGGERTRAALAKALLYNPELLILDEPTNYLDLKGLNWLERLLIRYDGAVLCVSHDRHFLDSVANTIWELDHETLQAFSGNYSKYRVQKGEQVLWQRKRFQRQQEFIAKEEAFIRRYGAGQRASEARGRARRLSRLERLEAPQEVKDIRISSVTASRTGQVVVSCEGLEVGFKENNRVRQLIKVPDITLQRNGRTGIIGSNGSGKTTLLKTILGMVDPLEGSATLGHNVDFGYFNQESYAGPGKATVFEALLGAREMPLDKVRPYLAKFLFTDEEVFQTVDSLSGGEKSRLALARLLINEPNLLVLDEPTTHLDIATREALEQVLMEYDGTILFVSHDRHLISLMAKELWIIEDHLLKVFDGTFDEWQNQSSTPERQPPEKSSPRRTGGHGDSSRNESLAKLRSKQIDDLENDIADLEGNLSKIEHLIALASEDQNVEGLSELGTQHNQLKELLDQKWQDLGNK